jgi:hypothetical protein
MFGEVKSHKGKRSRGSASRPAAIVSLAGAKRSVDTEHRV